ncbi:hypothetical protein SPBR_02360 [Sporothrix brasiliensis 5110]|uniref:FAD-binding FR-type domain-containing protein n=1 Tax=Sporothrix brasiliensis 5110 TaxID=1398154 RepID=A0A0C2F0V1_9PEZI|nr:uncharacterized protein SPBR_02360 [Sporothrix brasiliensis 5110]KIH92474.1 hypothetical protein SPBR_02360 [Sporothrix brasiliensis 5110]
MARIALSRLLAIVPLLSLVSVSVVSAQTGTGIIGYGISFWQDLCCQACADSLSALYLNCTTFSDGDMGGDGMDMGGDDMGGMLMGTTSDACRASNTPWLQTMAYCIQSNCDAHGYVGADKQAACFVAHALGGDAAGPSYQDSLPATAPTAELDAAAVWLNATSLVNADLYASTYGSEGNFAESEYYHTKYAMVVYLTTIGIIVACGLFAQLRGALPAFERRLQVSRVWSALQQHVGLPALLGRASRHHEPSFGGFGYVPSRALSLFIGVYLVLNIVLCCVSFSTFAPNTFWNSPQFNLCEFVGNRTGTLSLVNLSMAVLFAGRNNLLLALTGWSQSTFLALHRWAARVAAVQAVVHSIVYTYAYYTPGYAGASAYAAEVAMPFYWWGIVGTIAFCLAASLAVLPLRTRWYEIFLVVHIALAILVLVGCWYHLVPHFGYIYGYQTWLYITFAFWAFDRAVRVGRILYYSRLYMGRLRPQQHQHQQRATVEAVPGSANLVHVTVYPRTWHYGPGQHAFLYFPSLGWGKGWESHPFSVAAWNDSDTRPPGQSQSLRRDHGQRRADAACGAAADPTRGSSSSDGAGVDEITEVPDKAAVPSLVATTPDEKEASVQVQSLPHHHHRHYQGQSAATARPSVEFLIRTRDGMTAWLRDHAATGLGRAIDLPLYTEGPYAGHRATLQPLKAADTVLCVVGGIGITHALGILQEYVSTAQGRAVGRENEVGESGHTSTVMPRATRFILAWSAHEHALLGHVQERFLVPAAHVAGLEHRFWCTSPVAAAGKLAVTLGRMDVAAVVRSSLEVGRVTTVVVCGPGAMADATNRAVVQAVHDGFHVDSIEESFKW